MVVAIRSIEDDDVIAFVVDVLKSAGFDPVVDGDRVRLHGAGVGSGDHSVDLAIRVLSVDEVRIVHFESLIRSHPGTFDAAVLAAARGNGTCIVPKFEVVEDPNLDAVARFRVKATVNLYADHVSAEEFRVMLHLFVKEVDAIDNELADILSERGRPT